jgi:hypothetical protein
MPPCRGTRDAGTHRLVSAACLIGVRDERVLDFPEVFGT